MDQRSQAGFRDSPSGRQPGGVEIIEHGKIVRTLTVHLAGVHRLGAGADKDRGRLLRQYVLGLALAAATAPLPLFLRQGCSLVPPKPKNGEKATRWHAVGFDGSEDEFDLSHDEVISYTRTTRDRLFPEGLKNETWAATKAGAQAEVKKRAKSDEEAGTAVP